MLKITYSVAGEQFTKELPPLKAIRAKCLDCCAGSAQEVKLCTASECPLFEYRLGTNPNRKGVGGNPSFKKNKANSSSQIKNINLNGCHYPIEKKQGENSNLNSDMEV